MRTRLEILLVEHDPICAERIAAELVERFGATVHMPQTEKETLSFVRSARLDGAFVAVDHPYIEPVGLIRLIRQRRGNRRVPLVVLSPNEELPPLATASQAGANFYLIKPLIRAQLHRLMRTLYPRMIDSRRAYQRVSVDLPVLCRSRSAEDVGASLNLSASGMLISLDSKLKPRQRVQLTFPFDRDLSEPFSLSGRVARTEGDGKVAVAFCDIPADQLARLKMWVEMAMLAEPGELN